MSTPTEIRRAGLCAAALGLAGLLAAGAPAQAQESYAELSEKILDGERRLRDREDHLKTATRMARRLLLENGMDVNKMGETQVFRDAVQKLIQGLAPKAQDITYATFIQSALAATESWKPWEGLGPGLRPFLKKGPFMVKLAALRVINEHGAEGVGDILLEMLEDATQNPGRSRMEITLIDAAEKLPHREGVPIMAKALEVSQFKEVRLRAARQLGEFRGVAGKKALVAAAVYTNRDEVTACTAAESLLRYGSYEGVAELIKRIEMRKAATFRVYRALCKLANVEEEGFKGIPPDKWYSVGRDDQKVVIDEILAWWEKVKDSKPRNQLMVMLKAKGVKDVPAQPDGKQAVTALLHGLDLEPLSLRYRALDMLNELAGDSLSEWLYDFRSILKKLNEKTALREWEPQHGYKEQEKVEQLKREQSQKAALARSWWSNNKDKVEFINGQWRLPNN